MDRQPPLQGASWATQSVVAPPCRVLRSARCGAATDGGRQCCACVRVCVRACVCACVRVCAVCMHVCVCMRTTGADALSSWTAARGQAAGTGGSLRVRPRRAPALCLLLAARTRPGAGKRHSFCRRNGPRRGARGAATRSWPGGVPCGPAVTLVHSGSNAQRRSSSRTRSARQTRGLGEQRLPESRGALDSDLPTNANPPKTDALATMTPSARLSNTPLDFGGVALIFVV